MPAFKPNLPPNWHHTHLPETTSTMLALQQPQFAERSEEFVLLSTDYQTAGRGQRGTSWEAERGANLLFGFLFRPSFVPASQQFSLSEALALAVRAALDRYAKGFTVKWSNDIYYQDRKICGMLLEHRLSGHRIASTLTGVGINVNQSHFCSDAPNPVSLCQIIGHDIDRAQLLAVVCREFELRYRSLQRGHYAPLHDEYIQHLYRREGLHRYCDSKGEFEAEISAISPIGTLTLKKADGSLHNYAFKEVKFIL